MEGTRLPAGFSLTSCLPGVCFQRSGERRTGSRVGAHVCLPGSASPPACRGSASPPACRGSASPPACRGSASPPACRGPASPPACRGRRLSSADRRPLAPRLPGRPLVATEPARRARACRVAPLVRSKPATYPRRPGRSPSRLDNPNRPVSILSNSEPALCALAPARSHQAPAVPVRSPGFARTCRRAPVAAATPKPARQALRLAVFPGRNHQNGEPPPLHAFRHVPERRTRGYVPSDGPAAPGSPVVRPLPGRPPSTPCNRRRGLADIESRASCLRRTPPTPAPTNTPSRRWRRCGTPRTPSQSPRKPSQSPRTPSRTHRTPSQSPRTFCRTSCRDCGSSCWSYDSPCSPRRSSRRRA